MNVSRFVSATFLLYLGCGAETREPSEYVCGGRFTSPAGVFLTPHFPKAFAVPIRCRWIIDVSDVPSTNSSIDVYLTQLYVYKGLTFTEYAYYESDVVNFGASLITEITEGNVFRYKRIRTFRPFLVVDFQLDRLEGNHVRVLNDLLEVFGFNLTYRMTDDAVRSDTCSLQDCSFAGDCLVSSDYLNFYCRCFRSFSGLHCNEGPLCSDDRGNSVCRNNGFCRQIGAEAMECHCQPNFVGRYCQTELSNNIDEACPTGVCIVQCPHIPNESPCNCSGGTRIYNDRSRFECRIKLFNVTSLKTSASVDQHGTFNAFLAKQLAKYLRNCNISSAEDLKILNVTHASEVTFHFFGNTEDGDRIREALNRLVQRRRFGEIALESTHFTFQQKPTLRLQSLRVHPMNDRDVRLGDRIMFSCVARGSYALNFTWYKDGMLVDTAKATRDMRCERVMNDASDTQTSLLTIDGVALLDTGQYTCRVVDWGMEQCKSIYVEVRDEPDVKIVPMSVTIEKGGNVQLTCMTPNMRSIGIGFGWTKNKALLKLEPGSEVWEDLYPAGSILKISNVQKSAIYTCNVAHKSTSVRVEVMNRTLIPICPGGPSWGLHWPDTAPGSEALLQCPSNFVGPRVSRLCSMKDATTPEWQIPDFSSCIYAPLLPSYDNFRALTLGYDNTTGSKTILAFWNVLRDRFAMPLYPGEGDRIVNMIEQVERYQFSIDPSDLHRSTDALTRIVDYLLTGENSLLEQRKLSTLLRLTERNLVNWSKNLDRPWKHVSLPSMVVDIQRLLPRDENGIARSLQIPVDNSTYRLLFTQLSTGCSVHEDQGCQTQRLTWATQTSYPRWYGDRIAVRLWEKKPTQPSSLNVDGESSLIGGVVVVVVYKNVSRFLPITYVKELDDGTDLEYRVNSRIITVSVPNFSSAERKVWVDLRIRHMQNKSGTWNVSCGFMDRSGSWDLDSCVTSGSMHTDITVTHCLCPRSGTIALFLTARAVRVVFAKREQTTFIVVFGCASCLVQCIVSSVILGSLWWKHRTWLNFLKLQCCGALAGAMAIFVSAVQDAPYQSSFSVVAISLEAFLLVGMSAPISEALIIYAELAHVRPSQHLQPTVIAVITGVPVLAVMATELARKSTSWHHESWWLVYGSGVYNIFVSCAAMMFIIFVVLYMGVLHKAHALLEGNVVKRETTESRIRMLHRAAVVICGIIAMEMSSIFYVNSTSIIFHYVFASLSSALGFLIIIVHIVGGEYTIVNPILRKLRWKDSDRMDEAGRVSESVKGPTYDYEKACSKSKTRMKGDLLRGGDTTVPSVPPSVPSITGDTYLETRGIAAGSIDTRDFLAESPSSVYPKPSAVSTPSGRFLPEIRIDRPDDINLENYSTSPRKYQETFDSSFSSVARRGSRCAVTESCANDCCDFREFGKYDNNQLFFSPGGTSECSAKVLCSAEVESRCLTSMMPDVTLPVKPADHAELLIAETKNRVECANDIPDIANTSERKQPDGEEKAPDVELVDTGVEEVTTTNGMLDRISHDLDYLLNRTHTGEGV